MTCRGAIVLLASLILSISCREIAPHEEATGCEEVSIAHLKSLCSGDHYSISEDYTIRGIVVATDWLGEMNKSAVIMDESGGLEFAIDSHNINQRLPLFSEVEIFCNGLTLARIGGKVELGIHPTGEFPIESITDELFERYIRVVGSNVNYRFPVRTFTEIGVEDVSCAIRFDNVRICDEEQGLLWCDFEDGEAVTTYRTIVDREGNRFEVEMLGTSLYAGDEVPKNEVSVTGIINYSNNRYTLRIINKSII